MTEREGRKGKAAEKGVYSSRKKGKARQMREKDCGEMK
jgi:hypothetical protein